MKKNMIQMDIRTSVNYAEVQIMQKNGAFFVDTDFGRICIETNALREINPIRPVNVLPWSEAPDTKFAVDRCDESADWWANIDIYGSHITDHLSVIEIFTRAMFLYMGIHDLDDAIVDAAVYLFVASYDSYTININMIEREFVKNHIKTLHFGNKRGVAMRAIVRELFAKKISDAERVYRRSEKVLNRYMADSTNAAISFYDEYCKELFGLILYANNEEAENARWGYKTLLEHTKESGTDRSITAFKDAALTHIDIDIVDPDDTHGQNNIIK